MRWCRSARGRRAVSVTTTTYGADGLAMAAGPADASAARPVPVAAAKRVMDVVVATAALAALAPLLLVVAVAVGLSSPGPVLFRQRRVGRGGGEFEILKFRTMGAGAERHLRAVPELHAAYLEGGYKLPVAADPRVTAVGRVLRRLDLDELPQLWNVVRGDMSLVGPRPVLEAELALHYGADRRFYEQVRPGMTGLWQVSGRNRLDHARRVALDVDYATNLRLGRDLAILVRTLPAVARGGGGRREERAPLSPSAAAGRGGDGATAPDVVGRTAGSAGQRCRTNSRMR